MLKISELQEALLSAEERVSEAMKRLLFFCESKAHFSASLFCVEQECLFVDQKLFSLRPDLMLTGRSLVGGEREREARDSRGRIKSAVERGHVLLEKGLFLKKELREAAREDSFSCLFHEKPFSLMKGLGCSFRWILQTDAKRDLLDPRGDFLVFGALWAAIARGISRHAPLIWASIASRGNDLRFEGPLSWGKWGEEAAAWAAERGIALEKEGEGAESLLGWTGREFVFSGAGASQEPFLAMVFLQTIVANSLQVLLDEWERESPDGASREEKWERIAFSLQEALCFSDKEFPKILGYEAYSAFVEMGSIELLDGILGKNQLQQMYDESVKIYAASMKNEACTLIDLFHTQILPACLQAQKQWSASLEAASQAKLPSSMRLMDELVSFSKILNEAVARIEEVERVEKQIDDLGWDAKAKVLAELILPKMKAARESIDELEKKVDHALWPLPKSYQLCVD